MHYAARLSAKTKKTKEKGSRHRNFNLRFWRFDVVNSYLQFRVQGETRDEPLHVLACVAWWMLNRVGQPNRDSSQWKSSRNLGRIRSAPRNDDTGQNMATGISD